MRMMPIPGFYGYWASEDGDIFSARRSGTGEDLGPIHKMKPRRDRYGYLDVTIRNGDGRSRRKVHRLVLEAFVGARPEGMQACHADHDRANNALSNLRWGTPGENRADSMADGRVPSGERHGRSRLNDIAVAVIRFMWSRGLANQYELAGAYGLAQSHVGRICRGEAWAHLPLPEDEA